MALTVHLTQKADHRLNTRGVPTLVFETDGVCAFFEPTFLALGQATGKHIDPYTGARVVADLLEFVRRARRDGLCVYFYGD